MRSTMLLGLAGLSAALLACDARRFTGPDVAPLALVAAPAGAGAPLIFVDGRRLPRGTSLDYLRAADIAMIEVVKHAAALRLYGEEGRNGVVLIYLKPATSGARN